MSIVKPSLARRRLDHSISVPRAVCERCWRALKTCYCDRIRPFSAGPLFVILLHPKEAGKKIGTGRLTHLCILNSRLIRSLGHELDQVEQFTRLISDPVFAPVVLFPGRKSLNLSVSIAADVSETFPAGRRPLIFVIDGTWPQAKKMIRTSTLLSGLKQIQFNPRSKSNYRIRTQPKDHCLSSLEAVHTLIELFDERGIASKPSQGEHQNLLDVFDWMVELQIQCEENEPNPRRKKRNRRSENVSV